MAGSGIGVLMIEELTGDVTSIDSIKTAIDSGAQQALVVLNEATEEAEAEVSQLFGFETSIPIEVR